MSINTGQLRGDQAPHLDQYFGVWAMELDRFMLGYEHVRRMNLSLHVKRQKQKKKDRLAATSQAAPIVCASGGGGLPGYGYSLTPGGVAIVEIVGTMMKQETSLGTSTSTVKLRRTLRALAEDPSVKAVLIVTDSPGGTSAGTGVLGDEIARLAAKKPVNAYVDDGLCASACYWAASQCSFISCDPRALVGSIGTYAVIEDSSRAAANAGVTVHLVKAGKWKGAGVDGTPVSDEQLARWQALVDETNSHFLAAVSRGRKMSAQQVAALDADVLMGEKAKAAGLVDAVESFDDALARLENMSPAGPVQAPTLKPSSKPNSKPKSEDVPPAMSSSDPAQSAPAAAESAELLEPIASAENKGDDMSQPQSAPAAAAGAPPVTAPVSPLPAAASAAPASAAASNEPKPATLAELEAAFADDLPFAFGCAKLALTVQEAKASYADKLKAENARLREQNAAAAQAAAAAAAAPIVKRPGVPALPAAAIDPAGGRAAGQRGAGSGEARDRFDELVAEQRKSGKSRQQAVSAVAKQNPDLHLQMLQEANPDRVLDRALLNTRR